MQQLRYREVAELLRILRRAADQRQVIANNLKLCRVIESLPACTGVGEICEGLMQVLGSAGFRGMVLRQENGGSDPKTMMMTRTARGALQFVRPAPTGGAHRGWSLGMDLVTTQGQRWGSITLIREDSCEPLLLDLNLLSANFSTALADAFQSAPRQLPTFELPQVPPAREKPARPSVRVARPRWHPSVTSPQA